jgi:hypothetical protein
MRKRMLMRKADLTVFKIASQRGRAFLIIPGTTFILRRYNRRGTPGSQLELFLVN